MNLKVENLNIHFNENNKNLVAIKNLSFNLEKGEILGLVGESGCGKSITSLSLMGLLNSHAKTSGTILFNGNDLNKISKKEMRKIKGKDISMIFQEPLVALNPLQKVGRQISEVLKIHYKLSKKERYDKVINLMNEVNLPLPLETYNKYPHELSGGQRQRVVIAMAIACNPSLIIADEPTTALDVTTQAQIIDLLKKINKKYNSSILFISHDLDLVNTICHKVAIMYNGYIVEIINIKDGLQNIKHPYSKALLNSVPHPYMKDKPLKAISGLVPGLESRETGCPFKRRCSIFDLETCNELPNLEEIQTNHLVRCFKKGGY